MKRALFIALSLLAAGCTTAPTQHPDDIFRPVGPLDFPTPATTTNQSHE